MVLNGQDYQAVFFVIWLSNSISAATAYIIM